MSISTKTGDKGKTSLWSGERCNKSNIRVEAYGTVDELNANLSEAKHLVKSTKVKKIILKIQNDLFKVAGSLATIGPYKYPIEDKDVERITKIVELLEAKVKLKGFVIPGSTPQSAKLDVCRTIARRAERRILTLNKKKPVDDVLKQYINRLSDLIFVIARYEEFLQKKIRYHEW
jgi:cob(I)alamin adenosyltransferase